MDRYERFSWNGNTPPRPITHWTARGVFSISGRISAGSPIAVIALDDREIGTALTFSGAALWLADGRYDRELGFSAADAGVPADVSAWNSLK